MLTIHIRSTDDRIESVPFESDAIVVGRAEDCGVRLPDRNISRNHVKLTRGDDGVFAQDLDSSFGTTLNGARLQAGGTTRLRPGDVLQLGYYALQVDGIEDLGPADTAEADLIVEFESEADSLGSGSSLEVEVVNADTDPLGVPTPRPANSVATPVAEDLLELPDLPDTSDGEEEWEEEIGTSRSRGGLAKALFFLLLFLAVVAGLVYFIRNNVLTDDTLEESRPSFLTQPQDERAPSDGPAPPQ